MKNFLFDKKGQGLSLNVIIVAALALVVLVILVVVFTGGIGDFTSGINEAELKTGYGVCHPKATSLAQLKIELKTAGDDAVKVAGLKEEFNDVKVTCNKYSHDETQCKDNECSWK